jgi:hypothetical protein
MITFGRFGHKKDKEKEQKMFLKYLYLLLEDFTNFFNPKDIPNNLIEKELVTPLKKNNKKRIKIFL